VLGLKLPWRAGGRPLVGSRSGRGRTVTVVRNDRLHVSAPLSTLLARRARTVSKQVSVFGTGSLDRVYRIGPHRELLGRSVSSLAVLPAASGTRVTIDDRQLLDSVDRTSGFVPVYLEGRLFPDGVRNDLAIALNGKVAAVTKTFDQHGQTRFTAMVREDALQNGRNAVEIFRLDDAGGSVRLVRLRGSDLSFSLLNGGSAIGIGARSIPVRAGALRGVVRARREQTGWVFSGWAAQRSANLRVDTLVVFVGDRAVYTGRAVNLKPQAILGQPELGKTGFEFELPPSLLPAADSSRPVRVFALHARTASELRYDAAFPWR
jgi:hypothetical protein